MDGPALIAVNGSVLITIDAKNNVTIDGYNKLYLRNPNGDIELDAKNIDIRAKENLYLGTETEIHIQTKKLNINPKRKTGGYKKCSKD